MHYTHLAKEERYYICQRLKSGKSIRQIALEMNRSYATISREIARSKGVREYHHKQAHKKKGRAFIYK